MHGSSTVNFPLVVLSILATSVFWGMYGPFLQWGHGAMESGRMRPFICVGIAYVLVAVIGPILVITILGMENEGGLLGGWTMTGIWWSLMAGVVGALGALGMLLAFNFGGKPHYVPPLIFGLAPVVNTFFTLWMNDTLREQLRASPARSMFFGAGLLMVAVGAVTVLVSAPKGGPPKKDAKAPVAHHEKEAGHESEHAAKKLDGQDPSDSQEAGDSNASGADE